MAMTLRLPDDWDTALDEIARAQHVSKHALVLQGVALVIERQRRRGVVDEALEHILSHDAELLRRLADA